MIRRQKGINDEGRERINLYHIIYLWKHYKLVKKQLFIIAAGFGSSYGVAIGFSLTSAVELVYWMFIKPFGLEKQEQCSKCTKHHYMSIFSRHITRFGQGITTTYFLAYFWYRFYLVAFRYYYPLIPEENRNQIIKNLY